MNIKIRMIQGIGCILLALFVSCKTEQQEDVPLLSIETDSVSFSSSQGSKNITCSSGAAIKAVSSQPSWCTVMVYPIQGGARIGITVTANDSTSEVRTAVVTVTAGNKTSANINVTQAVVFNNVEGYVKVDGAGLANVVVSDGYVVSTTNADGYYGFLSQKKIQLVFMSIPGGYFPPIKDNVPQFFKYLSADVNTVEQINFELTPVNNNEHVIIATADYHMARRTADLSQFNTKCLPDINGVIDTYKAAGKKTYIVALGDLTWDLYWVANNYALPDYAILQKSFNTCVFNLIGNHDHDPFIYNNDRASEQAYRNNMGPNWYSFNLGQVHYVVLDNINYINNCLTEGAVGDRSCTIFIDSDQTEWLKKDLALISDKSAPLIILMHAPLYNPPPSVTNSANFLLSNYTTLLDCLSQQKFTDVKFLSGHAHTNHRVTPTDRPWLMDHNLGAICATWWWTGNTGYAGNHICTDGSPGGFGVYELNGKNMEWYYKSIGYDRTYQFRTYDCNEIEITAAKYAPAANATYAAMAPTYAGEYAESVSDNRVLINVWGYEPSWKVEVNEGSTPLTVTRVLAKDPLHIISYEFQRLTRNASPTSSFVTTNTSHIFSVTANSVDSILNIKVTDRFGNEYTETMIRPKAFNYAMR